MSICNCSRQSSVLAKLLLEGYTHCLIFVDGALRCPQEERKRYTIVSCKITPLPDPDTETTIYKIECSDGLKAHASVHVLELEQD